jgi:hypothetical protein
MESQAAGVYKGEPFAGRAPQRRGQRREAGMSRGEQTHAKAATFEGVRYTSAFIRTKLDEVFVDAMARARLDFRNAPGGLVG